MVGYPRKACQELQRQYRDQNQSRRRRRLGELRIRHPIPTPPEIQSQRSLDRAGNENAYLWRTPNPSQIAFDTLLVIDLLGILGSFPDRRFE